VCHFLCDLRSAGARRDGAKPARLNTTPDSACAAGAAHLSSLPRHSISLPNYGSGISCSGGVPLLNSSPTRTVGPTHTPAHSGGVAHLSELFAKIAAPPHPGEASGPSTAPARSRPSDRALPAAG